MDRNPSTSPDAPPPYSQTNPGYEHPGESKIPEGYRMQHPIIAPQQQPLHPPPQQGLQPSAQPGYPPPQGYPPYQQHGVALQHGYPPNQQPYPAHQGYLPQQPSEYPQPTTQVTSTPVLIHTEPTPESYLVHNCLVAFFCCLCIGLYGVYKSYQCIQASTDGQLDKSRRLSNEARRIFKIGLIAGIVSVIVAFIPLVVVIVVIGLDFSD